MNTEPEGGTPAILAWTAGLVDESGLRVGGPGRPLSGESGPGLPTQERREASAPAAARRPCGLCRSHGPELFWSFWFVLEFLVRLK